MFKSNILFSHFFSVLQKFLMQDFVAFRARFLSPSKLDLQKLWGKWGRGAQNLFFDATFSYLSLAPHRLQGCIFLRL